MFFDRKGNNATEIAHVSAMRSQILQARPPCAAHERHPWIRQGARGKESEPSHEPRRGKLHDVGGSTSQFGASAEATGRILQWIGSSAKRCTRCAQYFEIIVPRQSGFRDGQDGFFGMDNHFPSSVRPLTKSTTQT